MDVVISFDTTGSMYHCLEQVRAKIREMIPRLRQTIPGIRIAIFAHGDYGDSYVTRHQDFSTQADTLCRFAQSVGRTGGGGNGGEAYEMVLKEAAEKLSWRPGSRRFLVMMGDEPAHEPYHEGNRGVNWRTETDKLRDMGMKIYAVQCGDRYANTTQFYRSLAERTGGHHLQLSEVDSIVDILMLICTREGNKAKFETFEEEIRRRSGAGQEDEAIAAVLRFLKSSKASPR